MYILSYRFVQYDKAYLNYDFEACEKIHFI